MRGASVSRSRPVSRFRVFVCGATVVAILLPALLAPPSALLVAVPAALAVAAPMLPWPLGRVSLARTGLGLGAVSLAVTAGYAGMREAALLWLPFEVCGLAVLLGRVVRGVPGRRVAVVAAVTGAAAVLVPLRVTLWADPPDWRLSLVLVVTAMFPATLAAAVGLYLRALDTRRERAVAEARREQRLELARDLHDFVAHELTGILLEVQAAQVQAYDPEENKALLARLEEASLRALESMDETLRALRDPDAHADEMATLRRDRVDELPALVERFRGAATKHAVLELEDGLADLLPRQVQRAVYRVVLESLTNVRRHAARATEVTVSVRRAAEDRDAVEVTVTDDGGRGGLLRLDRRRGGGTGLVELAARVEALGGTLTAGPREKGWCVRARIPIRG
jgi:signal transduction histidine kinase